MRRIPASVTGSSASLPVIPSAPPPAETRVGFFLTCPFSLMNHGSSWGGGGTGRKSTWDRTFAPVASVIACDDFEEALRQADETEFGLQVGVFTRDVNRVFQAMRRLNFGGIIINDTPAFRTDAMPYGGNRQSGLGREGVRFAMEDMTNIQLVAIRTG